jgi:hypothetical protein
MVHHVDGQARELVVPELAIAIVVIVLATPRSWPHNFLCVQILALDTNGSMVTHRPQPVNLRLGRTRRQQRRQIVITSRT